MKLVSELSVGDVIRSPLLGEKKGIPRVVCRLRARTPGLTYVETVHKHERNAREVWELPSDVAVIATQEKREQGTA